MQRRQSLRFACPFILHVEIFIVIPIQITTIATIFQDIDAMLRGVSSSTFALEGVT